MTNGELPESAMAARRPGHIFPLPSTRSDMAPILPKRHQRTLPLEQLILAQPPGAEAIEMDVLFVGAGPAGLAGAIELCRLVKQDQASGGGTADLNIGVLEKAGSLGEHSLSGAVVNRDTPDDEKGRAGGWSQAGNLRGAGLGGGAGLWLAQHSGHPWISGAVLARLRRRDSRSQTRSRQQTHRIPFAGIDQRAMRCGLRNQTG